MKKMVLCMTIVLGFAVVAQAQCETDKLLEKVLLVQFMEEANIDSYDMAEFLAGYEEYRATMDMLEKTLADAKAALEAAVAAGDSTSLSSKMRAMMTADKAVFDAKQSALSQASMLLDSAAAAKLALIVADLPNAKKVLQESLADKAPCDAPVPVEAAAEVAAEVAAPAEVVASPEEEVMAAVNDIIATIKAGDVEKLLGLISEDFYQPQVGDKEAVKEYAKMGKDMGYLDNVPATISQYEAEISLEDTEVELKDGEATVYPIDAVTNQGSATVELVLKKESDGKWRVVGGDAYGI